MTKPKWYQTGWFRLAFVLALGFEACYALGGLRFFGLVSLHVGIGLLILAGVLLTIAATLALFYVAVSEVWEWFRERRFKQEALKGKADEL